MYESIDSNILNRIFCLSDCSLIRMVNHLFQKEYADTESIWKDWKAPESSHVCLVVGGTDRYEFGIRHLDGCVQLLAEDRGCRFYETRAAVGPGMELREPGMVWFGENTQEEYVRTREFPGHEGLKLSARTVTFSEHSAKQLEEKGLILFLPFLFYLFRADSGQERDMRETLKSFVIRDIVGTLNLSMQRGNLGIYDVQRLKQLCRRMIWRLLPEKPWMQELEMQELILNALDTDLDLLERTHSLELQRLRNK